MPSVVSSSRTSYVAPEASLRLADPDASAEALQVLVRRYLEGFGPASIADMALFCLVQRTRAKHAVAALGDELEQMSGPGDEVLYDVPGAPRPPGDTPAPARLLGMWDNLLLAHVDRSRVIPADHRRHVTRRNGDILPTLLVDGYVAGVWRVVGGRIEATAFEPIGEDAWIDLAAEARTLMSLLSARDQYPYARYDHWWTKLPAGEVRVLPAEGAASP